MGRRDRGPFSPAEWNPAQTLSFCVTRRVPLPDPPRNWPWLCGLPWCFLQPPPSPTTNGAINITWCHEQRHQHRGGRKRAGGRGGDRRSSGHRDGATHRKSQPSQEPGQVGPAVFPSQSRVAPMAGGQSREPALGCGLSPAPGPGPSRPPTPPASFRDAGAGPSRAPLPQTATSISRVLLHPGNSEAGKGKEMKLPRAQAGPSRGTAAGGSHHWPSTPPSAHVTGGETEAPGVKRAAPEPGSLAPHSPVSPPGIDPLPQQRDKQGHERGRKSLPSSPWLCSCQTLCATRPSADVTLATGTLGASQSCCSPKTPSLPCGHTRCAVTRF